MLDFINQASSQLGISTDQATKATGGLLGMVQSQLGAGEFQKTLGGVPGVGDLISKATGGGGGGIGGMLGGGGGGGLGGLLGKASSMLGGHGGAAESALGIGSIMANSGLSMDKLGGLGQMLMTYLQGHIGQEGVQGLIGKLPELKKLIG